MKAITATVCTASTGTGVANGRIHRPRRDVENEEIQLYLSKLKELVPFMPKNRKLSKLEVIQYVIDYICDLQYALETHPTVATAVNSAVSASSLPVTTARHSGSCQQRQPLVVLAPNTILPCSSQDVAATVVVVLISSVPCGHLCWLSWLVCRLSILTEQGPTVVTKIPGTAASFLDCVTSLPPHDMLSKNTRSLVCAFSLPLHMFMLPKALHAGNTVPLHMFMLPKALHAGNTVPLHMFMLPKALHAGNTVPLHMFMLPKALHAGNTVPLHMFMLPKALHAGNTVPLHMFMLPKALHAGNTVPLHMLSK
uniref:BHLH domain-containing protein n=1 Tax=Timema cristinae TaxID=61476 RepID=A0A7R9CGR7_TIMCR|nr:unnamed protein product [Timema cristinae]